MMCISCVKPWPRAIDPGKVRVMNIRVGMPKRECTSDYCHLKQYSIMYFLRLLCRRSTTVSTLEVISFKFITNCL